MAIGYLVFRVPLRGRHDLIGTGLLPDFLFVLAGVVLLRALFTLPRRSSALTRAVVRAVTYLGVFLIAAMATTRSALARHEAGADEVWPPRVEIAQRAEVAELDPLDRAEWALRLALHAVEDPQRIDHPPSIPATWPWPADVHLGVRVTAQGAELWARVADSEVACHALAWSEVDELSREALVPACADDRPPPPELAFTPAMRTQTLAPEVLDAAGEEWPQHRRDADRTAVSHAVLDAPAAPSGWRTALRTPVRASASVVDGRVLVGGHGTGLVAALDLHSGAIAWIAHAPNWVHQEPVSDGAIVVVGFGDNDRSFRGLAPSGIAAFNPDNGAPLWTAFDESSVMTSPILTDARVVYATAAGLLKARDRATGALLGETPLPGGVIMGPPVASGDTLVATLDINVVCAHSLTTLRELWCRELPWLRMVGHSSAAIADGRVVLSAVATARTLGLADLRGMGPGTLKELARSVLFPLYWEVVPAGQVVLALDLASGAPLWRGPFYATRRVVDGHTAGTPAISGGRGVVVLPNADTVVAFDLATGRPAWSAGAHAARGPALVARGHAIVAGRDGVIEVRRIGDGVLACTVTRETGWDRAGPALAGALAVFVDLDGVVEAIPLDDLLSCNGTGASPASAR